MRSLFFSALLLTSILRAAVWTPGATVYQDPSVGVDGIVSLAYDSAANRVFALWVSDADSGVVYYSIYSSGNWSNKSNILSAASSSYVFPIYDAASNRVFAAWANNPDPSIPYYSIYSNESWSTPATIPLGASAGVNYNVLLAYESGSNRIFAAWGNFTAPYIPYYSIYSNGSWSTAAPIPLTGSASGGVQRDVAIAYHVTSSQVFAAWANQTDPHNIPYYSIYSNGSWSVPSTIPLGVSQGVTSNVRMVYDSQFSRLFAAWADATSAIYYSIYSNGTWQSAQPIPLGESVGTNGDVILAYESSSGRVFAAWSNTNTQGAPYYSVYTSNNSGSGSWQTATTIPLGTSVGANDDVFLAYNTAAKHMFAAWGDFSPSSENATHPPAFYSIASTLDPPSALRLRQKVNHFGLQSERFNSLKWNPSSSSEIVGYYVYRGSTLIATLGASSLEYEDHNREAGVTTNYSVVAFDASGAFSTPATITME